MEEYLSSNEMTLVNPNRRRGFSLDLLKAWFPQGGLLLLNGRRMSWSNANQQWIRRRHFRVMSLISMMNKTYCPAAQMKKHRTSIMVLSTFLLYVLICDRDPFDEPEDMEIEQDSTDEWRSSLDSELSNNRLLEMQDEEGDEFIQDDDDLSKDDEFMLSLLRDLAGILPIRDCFLGHGDYTAPEEWSQTLKLFAWKVRDGIGDRQ
jgi:hypothetical protein